MMIAKKNLIEMIVDQLIKAAYTENVEVTKNWLDGKIVEYCSSFNILEDGTTIEKLFREKMTVTINEAVILVNDDRSYKEWLTEPQKIKINWYFWERYKAYFKTKNIPKAVLRRIHTDTDRILSLMGDPKSETNVFCRGMVIGDVQSGKTNNYSALINKSADAGYKLIIVLTGTIENLRQQTQERLDEDFVGSVSIAGKSNKDRETKFIGVGKSLDPRLPFCLTDRYDDIKSNPSYNISTIKEPILVVTKKNKHMLQRLLTWLSSPINTENSKVEAPVLIIDDEADNASVNTGQEDEDPKTINRLIREVLNVCKRVSYVAYTATPFANIFIDPDSEGDIADTDDLFPKDFIVALEAPTNYCGPRYFFRNDEVTDQICIKIEDAEKHLPIAHKPGISIISIPDSLKAAIGVFLLACAIKDIRRSQHLISNPFDSMLINMSRLTTVQSDIRPFVDDCLDTYLSAIRAYAAKYKPEVSSSVMANLYSLWCENYKNNTEEAWNDVCASLAKIAPPQIVTIHSKSGELLTYEKDGPKKIIAIGGFKLSRGLTLEGLVVSYFYRRSIMYDSLMQMGRWYGYREGYQDLLRLWITDESLSWYKHISEASDDLREQVAEMQRRLMTPSQFGLRVRASPDALMVTAANKMRTAGTVLSRLRFDNRLLETDCVDSRPEVVERNFDVFSDFFNDMLKKPSKMVDIPEAHQQHFCFLDVGADSVIKHLRLLTNHPSCGFWAENDLFLNFVEKNANDELALWDVFVFQSKTSKEGEWIDKNGQIFSRVRRSVINEIKNNKNQNELRLSRKQKITDTGVEALGLTQCEMDSIEQKDVGFAEGRIVADRKYRAARKKPSLIFHIIKACEYDETKENIISERDVLGWAISIPQLNTEQPDILWKVTKDWFGRYGAEWTEESES